MKVTLNHEEIQEHPERKTIIKSFILYINITGKEQLIHPKQMIGKNLRKII